MGCFCVFYTEKQMSMCGFRHFCILTKKGIEILCCFVYNVLIVVLRT